MPTPVLFTSNGDIGFAKQTVQGTGVAASKFVKFLDHGYVPDQKIEHYRDGYNRDVTFGVKLSYRYRGAVKSFMYVDEAAALWAWFMGQDTKTGAGDPFTHTLAFVDPPPYISCDIGYYRAAGATPNFSERIIDTKIGSMTLDAQMEKPVEMSYDLMGASAAAAAGAGVISIASAAPTFNDGLDQGPMVFYQGAFTLVGPTDATTLQAQIQKINLEVKQGTKEILANQLTPIGYLEEARDLMVKLSCLYSGASMYDLVHYGANNATGTPSSVIGLGSFSAVFTVQASPERSATFSVPSNQLAFLKATPKLDPASKEAMLELEARPFRSGATLPLSVIFKNAVSTAF